MKEQITAQYRAVREHVGLLDRRDVALIGVRGPDRYTWLQGMVSNDTRLLANGKTQRLPACILNATGHLLVDVVLLKSETEPDLVMLELPASEREKTLTLLDRLLIMEAVELSTLEQSGLSLQGPAAATLPLSYPLYEADHTGSGGYDFYVPTGERASVIEAIRTQGILEMGADTQEILRVEAGIPKYGVDMEESVIALEAGLGPSHISFIKGCYVGQEIIARIDSRGHTNRALTGMVVVDGPLPSPGEDFSPLPTDAEPTPRETGRLTSVIASSPAVGDRPIALGYVRHEHRTPGSRLQVGETGTVVETRELPFYRSVSAKK